MIGLIWLNNTLHYTRIYFILEVICYSIAEKVGYILTSSEKTNISHKNVWPSFCIVSWWSYLMPCGMSVRIDGLVAQLKKMGVKPEVITPVFNEDDSASSSRETNLIKTLNLRFFRFPKIFPESIVKLWDNFIFFLLTFVLLSTRFLFGGRKNGFIVQYQDIFSAPAVILARVLFNITVIGDDVRLYFKNSTPLFSWIQRAIEILILKNTDLVVTSYKQDYLFIKNIRKNRGVLFVPNGIKMDSNLSVVTRGTNSVLFVGQFANTDNLNAVADILYLSHELKFSDAKIYIVGGPLDAVKELMQQNEFKTTNIEFLGRVSQEQLNLLYKKASIGILPFFGTSKHTSQRIKALEYLSNGLLVLASPRGVDGFNGLIDGKHYILAKTREDMLNLLQEILLNYGQYAQIAQAGRDYVLENYAWEKVASPYLKWISCSKLNRSIKSKTKISD